MFQGFYSVYSDVFARIAQEEAQFADEDISLHLPPFGKC